MNGRTDGVKSTQLIRSNVAARRAARNLAAVAAAGTAAALLASGCSAGRNSSGSEISPVQTVMLAAQQAKYARSFSSSLTITTSGMVSGTVAGTLEWRSRPLLLDADFSTVNFGGQSLPGGIQEILVGRAVYLKMSVLAQRFGKPWVKLSFAEIRQGTGINLAQIVQQAQQSNPRVQMVMLAAAKNVRVAGHQVIDGVPTTHFTGTYPAAAAIARLPSSLRPAERKAFQRLGVTSVRFGVWIDGQHLARKIVTYENGASEQVTLTMTIKHINQPLSVTLPPSSQVATISPPRPGRSAV